MLEINRRFDKKSFIIKIVACAYALTLITGCNRKPSQEQNQTRTKITNKSISAYSDKKRQTPNPETSSTQALTTDPALLQKFSVTDTEGTSVSTAQIALYINNKITTTSRITGDAGGIYTANLEKSGSGDLLAIAEGYTPFHQESIPFPTTAPLNIRLQRGGAAVKGKATTTDGTPVSSGTIIILDKEPNTPTNKALDALKKSLYRTETDSNGNFEFHSVLPGSHIISLSPDNKMYRDFEQNCQPLNRIVVSGNEQINFDIKAFTGFTVEGIVFDKESSAPLAGIPLTTDPFLSRTTTDRNGYYKLNNIFLSSSIFPDTEKYIQADAFSRPTPKDCTNTLLLQNIPLVEAVTISGKILNTDGFPIPEATVKTEEGLRFFPQNQFVVNSNSKGEYKIKLPPLTQIALQAFAKNYAYTTAKPIDTGIENISNFDITLRRGYTLLGTVVDTDNNPIPNANVTIYPGNPDRVFTDAQGSFRLNNVSEAYSCLVDAEKYIDNRTMLDPAHTKDGATSAGLKIVLTPIATLKGKLVNSSGAPASLPENIRFINVKFDKNGEMSFYIDPSGSTFKSYNLPRSTTYSLTIPGLKTFKPVEVPADKEDIILTIDDITTPTKKELITSNTAYVTVLSKTTRKLIPDAEIKFTDMKSPKVEKSPETSGVFILRDFKTDLVGSVSAKNYFDDTLIIYSNFDKKILRQTVELSSGGSVAGRVINKETNSPIGDLLVRIYESNYQAGSKDSQPLAYTTTDKDGKFTLPSVRSGIGCISITPKAPLAEFQQQINIKESSTLELGDIALSKGGRISGQFVNTDGTPRGPVGFIFKRTTNNAGFEPRFSDDSGKFTIENLPNAPYTIMLMNPYIAYPVVLSDGETKEVTIKLGGTKFSGTVTSGGKPYGGSGFLKGISNSGYFILEVKDGKFEIENVIPGEYTFNITTNKSKPVKTFPLEIPDQKEFSKDFSIKAATLKGTVKDSSGKPEFNVFIRINKRNTGDTESGFYADNLSRAVHTDSDGEYTIDALDSGTYDIVAVAESGEIAMKRGVIIGEENTTVNFTLQAESGKIESICIDAINGLPLYNASLTVVTPNGVVLSREAPRNDNGVAVMQNTPPGTYTVEIACDKYATAYHRVEVKSNETVKLEDALSLGGNLSWRILDSSGYPLIGAFPVVIEPINTEQPIPIIYTRTNGENGCNESGLIPGTYKATLTGNGETATEQFTIIAGESTFITTQMK